MTPYGFGPTGNGNFTWGANTGFAPGMGPGFPGTFPTGFGGGMGFQGNFGPGFGPGMGFPASFQPGFGMPFPGTFQPGFAPNVGTMGMGPGFGPGYGPVVEEIENISETVTPTPYMPGPMQMGWGLGGARRWGGTYSPQFLTTGLPTDDEIVEMVYDSIDNDPLVPFDADINVDSDAGAVTLTGTVATKQIKHAAGDDAWWIPGVDDVHNELNVERRHPAHAAQPSSEQRRTSRTAAENVAETQGAESTQAPRATRRGMGRR